VRWCFLDEVVFMVIAFLRPLLRTAVAASGGRKGNQRFSGIYESPRKLLLKSAIWQAIKNPLAQPKRVSCPSLAALV
jgi:hypothetical protein